MLELKLEFSKVWKALEIYILEVWLDYFVMAHQILFPETHV